MPRASQNKNEVVTSIRVNRELYNLYQMSGKQFSLSDIVNESLRVYLGLEPELDKIHKQWQMMENALRDALSPIPTKQTPLDVDDEEYSPVLNYVKEWANSTAKDEGCAPSVERCIAVANKYAKFTLEIKNYAVSNDIPKISKILAQI